MSTAPKVINFNAKFDTETDGRLMALAEECHQSKAAVVRALIRHAAAMLFDKTPTCATGENCRCPHAHIYGPTRSQAPPDPDRPQ